MFKIFFLKIILNKEDDWNHSNVCWLQSLLLFSVLTHLTLLFLLLFSSDIWFFVVICSGIKTLRWQIQAFLSHKKYEEVHKPSRLNHYYCITCTWWTFKSVRTNDINIRLSFRVVFCTMTNLTSKLECYRVGTKSRL